MRCCPDPRMRLQGYAILNTHRLAFKIHCSVCRKNDRDAVIKRCGGCGITWYCVSFPSCFRSRCLLFIFRGLQSSVCQRGHWAVHRSLCLEGKEFRATLIGVGRRVWDDVGEWLHRNWSVVFSVVNCAYTGPQTIDEFRQNGLVIFFKFIGNQRKLFERLELGFAKIVGNGEGSTNIGVSVNEMLPESFSAQWVAEEQRARERHGVEFLGVAGYIIAVLIDGTADMVYFPRLVCMTRSARERISFTSEWETRLWEHCTLLKLAAIWGRTI